MDVIMCNYGYPLLSSTRGFVFSSPQFRWLLVKPAHTLLDPFQSTVSWDRAQASHPPHTHTPGSPFPMPKFSFPACCYLTSLPFLQTLHQIIKRFPLQHEAHAASLSRLHNANNFLFSSSLIPIAGREKSRLSECQSKCTRL